MTSRPPWASPSAAPSPPTWPAPATRPGTKDGRRNRYQIQARLPLPGPASQHPTTGKLPGLLTRQRYREVPPRVDYELTDRAKELMPVLGALARWGYDWAWSAPRPGEDIDIGAIVRLAPGMLAPPKSLGGSLALEATGKHGAQRTYLLTARRGTVTVEEHDDEDADARVSGPQKAWIAAFGPEASRSGLKIEGNKKLAEALLDELAQVASSGRAAAAG